MCSVRKSLLANRISPTAFLAVRWGTMNKSLHVHSLAGRGATLGLNFKASLKPHCPSLTIYLLICQGNPRQRKKWTVLLKGISWFLPLPISLLTKVGRFVAFLVLMRTEAHGKGPGGALHFKASPEIPKWRHSRKWLHLGVWSRGVKGWPEVYPRSQLSEPVSGREAPGCPSFSPALHGLQCVRWYFSVISTFNSCLTF